MPKLRTIKDLGDLNEKTVIVRADLDVPVIDGEVSENFRIRKAAITIRELVQHGAKVVVIGHRGRPTGDYADEFSLMPVRFELGKLLDQHIKFAHINQSRNSIRYMETGEVILLENIRFHAEEQNSNKQIRKEFVTELGSLADYFVNDAFATYRVPCASTIELGEEVGSPVAGIQMQREIERLGELKDNPKTPYIAVIGGAKLDSKIPVLTSLTAQADHILMGGAMAYTFLKATGSTVGNSKLEEEFLPQAKEILKLAAKNSCQIHLPVDHICGQEFTENAKPVITEDQSIPEGYFGLDIGPKTLAHYKQIISQAESILWNGPMGVFEWEAFAHGTEEIAEYITTVASKESYKVAGGGDTIAAIAQLSINTKHFNHISTGGGAMLSFLAGETIPAIEALYR